MFKRLDAAVASGSANTPPALSIQWEGQALACRPGDSVAAALLAAGVADCRDTPVRGVARGPFCMMGVCFDCLVNIDGQPNRQACMTPVREGMVVLRQRGAREVRE